MHWPFKNMEKFKKNLMYHKGFNTKKIISLCIKQDIILDNKILKKGSNKNAQK